VKPFRTVGMIFYSIVSLAAIATVMAHLWRVQTDLTEERRLGRAFRNA
jgi:hypothetical protein